MILDCLSRLKVELCDGRRDELWGHDDGIAGTENGPPQVLSPNGYPVNALRAYTALFE